jgi:D-alanyl-D-alanine carboxypeptidase (penicillin-binding protein 5/6)
VSRRISLRRITATTLAVATLGLFGSAIGAPSAGAAPELPKPAADLVVDAGTGRIIVCDSCHTSLHPASTAKLVTALAAVERLAPNATVTADAAAAAVETNKIGFPAGTKWTLDQMLAALLMVSANDAAYSIAHTVSGDLAKFAPVLNATAKQLGMKESNLNDPAGLDTANSFQGGPTMSAYDLAIAARNVLAVPELAKYTGMAVYDFTDLQGVPHNLKNHNKMVLPGSGYTYAGATGMKTGFTNKANHTLVASATRNGRTMIAVILGAVDSGYLEAASLMDAGFATPPDTKGTGETLPPTKVSLYADRAADRDDFASLAAAPGSGATAAAASSGVPASIPSLEQAPAHPKVATTVASASSKKHSAGGFLQLRYFLLVVILAAVVVFLLRRRAVKRQRAARLARRRQRNAAMRSGGLPVVDGRYRPGMRLGPPVESHVRVRDINDPSTATDAELDSLEA